MIVRIEVKIISYYTIFIINNTENKLITPGKRYWDVQAKR